MHFTGQMRARPGVRQRRNFRAPLAVIREFSRSVCVSSECERNACDRESPYDNDGRTPWAVANEDGDPKPMIMWLRKARDLEEKEANTFENRSKSC